MNSNLDYENIHILKPKGSIETMLENTIYQNLDDYKMSRISYLTTKVVWLVTREVIESERLKEINNAKRNESN